MMYLLMYFYRLSLSITTYNFHLFILFIWVKLDDFFAGILESFNEMIVDVNDLIQTNNPIWIQSWSCVRIIMDMHQLQFAYEYNYS